MRSLALALACLGGLGCAGPARDPEPTRAVTSTQPQPASKAAPASAQPPTAVPAGPLAPARPDPRPPAFVAFAGQCPPGHERFESVCVHDDYMRHTPLTRLMDEVIAFRNGAPAPRVGSAPGQRTLDVALSPDAPRRPIDPSQLDPGALVASPEEIAQRERSVEDAARHRGELEAQGAPASAGKKPGSSTAQAPASAPQTPQTPETVAQAMLAAAAAGPAEQLRARLGEPAPEQPQQEPQDPQAQDKPSGLSQADCQNARAMAAEQRRTHCGLPPSEQSYCNALLPQVEAAAEALCAMAK